MSSSRSGQVINGYQIGPLLGVGGMGEVYQASHPRIQQPLAIKFLRADAADQEAVAQGRFIREIRILQALQHHLLLPCDAVNQQGDLFAFLLQHDN